ncbi:SGNH/GDSL hydrolase family protein [Shewanella sp. 1_MG-2023]|uniref:SGNH/GDSL hydrolase family protein n=1 Tax=unclassified Shewanella TaxID=196818 RepID=UPI0026E296D3|nr:MULTISPECIES: SGNH/GDSL hydrolase family protein [unclassified Shewanella]MDO6613289.1 SGNH/GDSL hydrolase family protein [Shewanella sp. 7_MG-2023]MDO6773225.1 SGNH/GDSL hydrolase family protein [Shewanella sp. 2_MG-2023]MDO6796620.1 SGNH/GDSL hydrolase family protein [Shewanella sp. 1_MG-2023]
MPTLHYLSLIFLWPIYLLQAIWVKKTTLKLPEPKGLREGIVRLNNADDSQLSIDTEVVSSSEPNTLSILVIGDSAAAGVGVETQQQALTGQTVQALTALTSQQTTITDQQTGPATQASYHKLKWRLIAKSGYSTKNCLNKLNHILSQAHQISADTVIISLGVNDVLSPISAKTWISQQQQLCELLYISLGCSQIIITSVPPMSAFPALPQPFRWFLGSRANEFNHALTQWIDHSSLPCEQLDMRESLSNATMAEDGFHPSAEIYQHWGKMAARLIQLNTQAKANHTSANTVQNKTSDR